MSIAAIVTVGVIIAVGLSLTLIVALRDNVEYGAVILFLTGIAASIVGVCFHLHADEVRVDKTRVAIEKRYDVDFSTGDFDELGRGGSFIKDGAFYECDIKGTGEMARMFCDEPPRPEFSN